MCLPKNGREGKGREEEREGGRVGWWVGQTDDEHTKLTIRIKYSPY